MKAASADAQRLRLIRLAQADGLRVRELLRLVKDESDTLANCTDAEVLAYARALHARARRRAGHVPREWSQLCQCQGCGPVWLWPSCPSVVIACPWCWNRVAGLLVPSPADAL